MDPTRDELRLAEIRTKLATLHVCSTDRLNLPMRYDALRALETTLQRRVLDARDDASPR